jgi:predicted nicotinamide N-methyase
LLDGGQFSDPDGVALARGISEGTWSHFGQIWPAAVVLAEAMDVMPVDGRRVLEVGCGLALAGIVTHRRKADVTACDRHPLSASFLRENLRLNGLPPLVFRDTDWEHADVALGRFDVIIGSDVLYEATHPMHLSRFVERHGSDRVEVVIVDPGRHRLAKFTALMGTLGFTCGEERVAGAPRTRIARYSR